MSFYKISKLMKNTGEKRGFVLISVFDKKGIAKFARILFSLGYRIISTEGTGEYLKKNGISYIPSQEISKNPEGLNGCIKTISFGIEAGILFDRFDPIHIQETKQLNVKRIDIVVCNFPPVKSVIKSIKDFNVRNVDVGGPLMVRAGATNFKHVLVVVDPKDYRKVAKVVEDDKVTLKFGQKLAIKAFTYTHNYDQEIIKYLKKNNIFS